MTKQGTPDLNELLESADRYFSVVLKLFKGIHDEVNGKSTNVDSTWDSATDSVNGEPDAGPDTERPDAFDMYIEMLERRAYEHGKRNEINAAAAIRRIINELRELDRLDA